MKKYGTKLVSAHVFLLLLIAVTGLLLSIIVFRTAKESIICNFTHLGYVPVTYVRPISFSSANIKIFNVPIDIEGLRLQLGTVGVCDLSVPSALKRLAGNYNASARYSIKGILGLLGEDCIGLTVRAGECDFSWTSSAIDPSYGIGWNFASLKILNVHPGCPHPWSLGFFRKIIGSVRLTGVEAESEQGNKLNKKPRFSSGFKSICLKVLIPGSCFLGAIFFFAVGVVHIQYLAPARSSIAMLCIGLVCLLIGFLFIGLAYDLVTDNFNVFPNQVERGEDRPHLHYDFLSCSDEIGSNVAHI